MLLRVSMKKKAHDSFARKLLSPRSWMQDLQRLCKMVADGAEDR
jgi:hypothetical protein